MAQILKYQLDVLTMLHDDCCEKDYPKIIDIGSCSLHVLHGAFNSGVEATDWFLNKIGKIFDGSLARQDTCISHVQWYYSAQNKAYKVTVYLLKHG